MTITEETILNTNDWMPEVRRLLYHYDQEKVDREMELLLKGKTHRLKNIRRKWILKERGDALCSMRKSLRRFNDLLTDDALLRKQAYTAYRYYHSSTVEDICYGITLNVGRYRKDGEASLPNFFPIIQSRRLLSESLPKDRSVRYVDVCAGWGCRMMSAIAESALRDPDKPIHYFGVDANPSLVEKLNGMADEIGTHGRIYTDVRHGFAENFIPEWENTMDLAMTCPPYFTWETYKGENTSTAKYPQYEDWRERFLRPTVENCCRYVKPGGAVIFVVKSVGKFPITEDVMSMLPGCQVSEFTPTNGKPLPSPGIHPGYTSSDNVVKWIKQ